MATHWKSALLIFTSFSLCMIDCTRVLTPGIDCVRDCGEHPESRICYYEFVVQAFEVQGLPCAICTANVTNFVTNDCQCVRADGFPRTMISVNRMMPGPGVYVCEGDEIVVDVTNKIDGSDTTIHWHGMAHRQTQYYDGVPFVTQCPIASGTTFRYHFTAAEAGTYLWHSHSGVQKADGMTGSLVIYKPHCEEPHGDLYDYDTWETVMFLQDWKRERFEQFIPGVLTRSHGQEADGLLINGLGGILDNGVLTLNNSSYAEFKVKQGFRYRFRLINGLAAICPVSIQIHNHNMTLISTDQSNVEPFVVDSIISMTGERYDFVLEANQGVGTYWIEARGLGVCEDLGIYQMAILRYEGAVEGIPTPPTFQEKFPETRVLNPVNYDYSEVTDHSFPITQLVSLESEYPIRELTPNRTLYIPFGIYIIPDQKEFFSPNNFQRYSVNAGVANLAIVSNNTFELPTSPFISQYNDIDPSSLCNLTSCTSDFCYCTNIVTLQLGEVVDIVIVDTAFVPELYHPIHLHGLKQYVLDVGYARDLNLTRISVESMQEACENGYMTNRTQNREGIPVAKDTISVPTNGYAYFRIVADNPGFWFMHCHIDVHMEVGMSMVFQVGDLSDIPPVPVGFPTCGSFKPDI